MTKFTFGLLGLSMLIAAPAMASAPALKAVKNADTLTKEVNLQTYAKPSKKAGVKKIGSAADLEGAYTWYGISQLSTNGGKTVSMSVSMTPGDVASEVYFSISARPEIELKGVVDVANSTFTINRQTMGFNTNYNTNEYFYIGQLVQEGEGHKLQEVEKVIGQIGENNLITFPEEYCLGISLEGEDGWFWLASNNYFEAPHYFVYNPDEWADACTVTFEEAWIKYALTDPSVVTPYEVTLQQNKENPNLLYLKNPYGENTPWAELNYTADKEGGILINVEHKDYVVVEKFVFSGMTIDFSEAEDGSNTEGYYMFNREAQYLEEGYTVEEAIDEMDYDEYMISNMEDDVITIHNPYFGVTTAPGDMYWWTNGTPSDEATAVISNVVLSGVESVEFDSNAPVKYFNLQGVEVANPEAGQIVIKKQGSKAVKVVVK